MRKDKAKADMIDELKLLQEDLRAHWLDRSLPDGWQGMDSQAPLKRKRTRITIRLDADMVDWFRKLGPGYGPRLNRILRVYWLGLLAGQVKSHWDEEELSPAFAAALEARVAALRSEE